MSRRNREKQKRREWVAKVEQKIANGELAAKKLPGASPGTPAVNQVPFDFAPASEEIMGPPDPRLEMYHTYSPAMRTKRCLAEFDERLKDLGEQHAGIYALKVVPSRPGRYKPHVTFYADKDAKHDLEPLEREKQAGADLNALLDELAKRWLGVFRLMIVESEKQEGQPEGEFETKVIFYPN